MTRPIGLHQITAMDVEPLEFVRRREAGVSALAHVHEAMAKARLLVDGAMPSR
jgi:hypothetical protein